MNKIKFEELNLSKDLLKAVADMGFVEATPIQAETIPPILEGHDIIGQAMTGTGKTAAFGLPAIEKIDPQNKAVQVLILCPTRELALQVSSEINKFLKYKKHIVQVPIYGGQPIDRQIYALRRGAQIVIGTPGRVMDHMRRGTLKFNEVKMMILDEADEMLNMGFRPDIELILKGMKQSKQTVLFSATMSPEILQLTKRYQKDPINIKVIPTQVNVAAVEQIYFEVESQVKFDLLTTLIDTHKPRLSIVFCNTKRRVDNIVGRFRARGYLAEGLHGDIRQAKRNTIMSKFRSDKVDILVATDVAARGIDVVNVEAVFNYEIPMDRESYVHRIGRTGRAGRSGKAFSFVSRMDSGMMREIKRYTNADIKQLPLPNINYVDDLKPAKPKNDKFKTSDKRLDNVKSSDSFKLHNFSKPIGRKHDIIKQDNVKPIDIIKHDIIKPGDNVKPNNLKADKISSMIKHVINGKDLGKYSQIIQKLAEEKYSSADVAAALLKIVTEPELSKPNIN